MIIILLLFLFVISIILFNKLNTAKKTLQAELLKNQQLSSENSELIRKNESLKQQISDLSKRVSSLSKYQSIINAEEKANQIIQNAKDEARIMVTQADSYKKNLLSDEAQIRLEAKETLISARQQAKSIIEQATIKMDSSVNESYKIIQKAEEKANEIAGSAYEAMKNANEYEKTIVAIKNTIKGYGDDYLKPTFSLLDDLSIEFSHTDAGQKLKVARDRNESLIRNKLAAKCSYMDEERKLTASNFVLDAFNGKVDSILSNVKKDNFGILEQKIKDAFSIVNHNGKAFRNAEISQQYLDSRLDELHWAVITQELKWQEKEEQRLIREQIREEEKAKREYEKAIKDAEKEEQLLKKLIEKAQKEVEKASEEEKAKFSQQLGDLEEKLKLAEEKNQRAISMAQQTKAGNVYIISNIGSFGEDVYKIGMTRRLDPLDRVRELGDASVPFEFDVHALIYSDDAPALEKQLHKKFIKLQLNKVNPRKEFFKVGLLDIKTTVSELGITPKWTMIAEAKQYRESLIIAEAIKKDHSLEQKWENYQEETENEIHIKEIEAIE